MKEQQGRCCGLCGLNFIPGRLVFLERRLPRPTASKSTPGKRSVASGQVEPDDLRSLDWNDLIVTAKSQISRPSSSSSRVNSKKSNNIAGKSAQHHSQNQKQDGEFAACSDGNDSASFHNATAEEKESGSERREMTNVSNKTAVSVAASTTASNDYSTVQEVLEFGYEVSRRSAMEIAGWLVYFVYFAVFFSSMCAKIVFTFVTFFLSCFALYFRAL